MWRDQEGGRGRLRALLPFSLPLPLLVCPEGRQRGGETCLKMLRSASGENGCGNERERRRQGRTKLCHLLLSHAPHCMPTCCCLRGWPSLTEALFTNS